MSQSEDEPMIFNFLDLNKKPLRVLLPLTEEFFNTIKKDSEGVDFDDMEYYNHFLAIRDYLFNVFMLNPHEEKTKALFKNAQLNQFDFKEEHKASQVKIVDAYYNVYHGGYIFVGTEPSSTFYTDYIIKDRLKLRLESNTDLLETLLEQFLDALGVDYTGFKEEEELNDFEMDMDSLTEAFLLSCWQEVKEEIQSNVFGMLFQATGCGRTKDLDTGKDIESINDTFEVYFKKRGLVV